MAASIPVIIVLGQVFAISYKLILTFIVVMALICGAAIIWKHASANATGEEWWQDESCSGWRGY